MDAASYLVAHAVLSDMSPMLGLLILAVAVRFGWILKGDITRRREIRKRIDERFARL